MPTATELTEKYIREHASIKYCLKKGILNYSALSRHISKELELSKKTTKEAILIAARRYKEKVTAKQSDKDLLQLYQNSNIEIKNNVVVYTIEKTTSLETLIDVERLVKKTNGIFFSIEGTKTITVVIQKQHKEIIDKKFKFNIIEKKENLSLITITGDGFDETPGAVNYISGMFFENGINIEEFMSCYDDTLIVVESRHLETIMGFLNF